MTKPWDTYEDTIKELYADSTLAEVRKIMNDRYNFKASTRAYRGRLIKWGIRKYNCRRRSDCSSISTVSIDGRSRRSDTTSPTLSQPIVKMETQDGLAHHSGGHMRSNEPRLSNLLEQSYDTMEMDHSQMYPGSYDRNRTTVLPTHRKLHCEWDVSPTQTTPLAAHFGHADVMDVPGSPYGYPPPLPAPGQYPLAAVYEATRTDRDDGRRNLPVLSARHLGAIHTGSVCFPTRGYRDYRHGLPMAGIGSFERLHDQVARHIPETTCWGGSG